MASSLLVIDRITSHWYCPSSPSWTSLMSTCTCSRRHHRASHSASLLRPKPCQLWGCNCPYWFFPILPTARDRDRWHIERNIRARLSIPSALLDRRSRMLSKEFAVPNSNTEHSRLIKNLRAGSRSFLDWGKRQKNITRLPELYSPLLREAWGVFASDGAENELLNFFMTGGWL